MVAMTHTLAPGWRLVLPVKASTLAKSRLVPPPAVARGELAHAFARDTLAAVFATLPPRHVLVVTADDRVRDLADSAGAEVVEDPGKGLNAAVREGVRRLADDPARPVGVLLADLPALRPADLACALAACEPHERAFVPDAEGTGTVLLTTASAALLHPRFGTGSASAHARDSLRLDLDLPRLRTDVDDDESLRAAAVLGLGAATRGVLSGVALR
jgi:2-phospho-L-lactate guanylyltransferase